MVLFLLIPENADTSLRSARVRYCVCLFLLHHYTEMLIINEINAPLFLFAQYCIFISEMLRNQRWAMFIDLLYVLHLCTRKCSSFIKQLKAR